MIAKPASSTPYSAFAFAVLAERAGMPSGVLNGFLVISRKSVAK